MQRNYNRSRLIFTKSPKTLNMLTRIIAGIFVLVALAGQTPAVSQTTPRPKVEIASTELLTLNSKVVNQEYKLLVHLPGSYTKNTDKSYPVVYVLDGQYDLPFITGVYGGQYYDGFVPEFIIVGITWGGKDPDAGSLRARDFSPTHNDMIPQSGNGPKFFEFIKTELIPFIKTTYRVTDDRTLVGSSFGGLFTLYALFNDPSLFHRYVLTSPALGWDNFSIRKWEDKYTATGSSTPVKLFMSIGELEGGHAEFDQFVDRLRTKKVKNLEFETMVLKNTGHAGTKPEGFGRGLQYVFERPSLKLSPAILSKLGGTYQLENDTVRFATENGKLQAQFGNERITLDAATEKDFYIKGTFLNVHFQVDNANKVTGFQLEQFDGSAVFKKVR
jgi:predicted alpha/beta superfamily hydrolase